MGILGGGGDNQPVTRYNGIRTAEAIFGTALPILIGQQRISWKLGWYGAFSSQLAKQQGAGGSGSSKGGSQYVYSASVLGFVCMGPCANFLAVWDSIGRYAMDTASETTTLPGGPNPIYSPLNQASFKQDLGAGLETSYSVTANDYGSPGAVVLAGTQRVPLQYTSSPTPGPGEYTITGLPTTPVYQFNTAQAGSVVTVNYVAFRYLIQEDELNIAAATVTVQYQSAYKSNVRVTYYPSGVALTPVSGTPTAVGTYNPNGGHYEFAAADFGEAVTISYIFNDPNTDSNAPSTLNLQFFGGGLGQSPWAYLTSSFPSSALGYSEVAYVASLGMYLGYSPVLPQLNFEILGPYSFGNGIPDANPADAIFGLLTNPQYKYNFPASCIDISLLGSYSVTGSVTSGVFVSGEQVKQGTTGAVATLIGTVTGSNPMVMGVVVGPSDATHTWVGQTSGAIYTPTAAPASSSARAMWSANEFFISDILDSQTSLMDTIGRWCEAGQVYVSWDEGKIKFIPLSDSTAVGHGVTYNPPTQPVIDLDDNDFVEDGKDKDPITFTQTPWQNRWNRVNIKWSVRSNDYNEDTLVAQDEASVQEFGLMNESAQDYQFICDEDAAQFAANMRLQRLSAIYTTYQFTLKSNFAFLSPGDIITVTDGMLNTPGTMFGRTPVRLTKVVDDPDKGIICEAENFPWSVGTSLLYNKQAQLPSNTNDGPQEDPGDTTAIIFEVPNRAAMFAGGKLYIFCNGSNVNWGGFQAYVSFNGIDYSFYGQFSTPARIGVTTADYPTAPPGLDNTDTLTVNMQQSGAVLQSVTAADRDALVTLSGMISPGQSFTAQKTAQTGTNIGTSAATGSPGSLGPNLVTSGVNVPVGGTTTHWLNPSGVTGAGAYATNSITVTSFAIFSDYLFSTGMGFAMPHFGQGPIVGLQFNIDAYLSSLSGAIGASINVGLTYLGSVIGGVALGVIAPTTTPTTYTIGSASDLSMWGLPPGFLTANVVNDPSFGIWIQVQGGGSTGSFTCDVRAVKGTITWAAGDAAAPWFNPERVSSTTLFSQAILTLTDDVTQWLVGTDFGFQLPFGFVLEGIKVEFEAGETYPFAEALATVQVGIAGQRVSSPKTASIFPGPGNVQFGDSTDTWGYDWDLDSLNAQGFNGLSVWVSMEHFFGATVQLRNMRVTLYGTSVTNLELIAYENADLVGQNTYALTSIQRGVMGSYPCDHPAGAVFVRMDQATIIYTIDANFNGKSIFFKFLSFNAYGNQLQSLADVIAYDIPIGGLSPGAIDIETGALKTGTPGFRVPAIESALSAVHGTFGVENIPPGYVLMNPLAQPGVPKWISLSGDSGGTAPGVNDMYIYLPPIAGTYGTGQELFFAQPVRLLLFPAGLLGSHAGCRVAPFANVSVVLNKNGSPIGTVDIATGATVATFTFAADVQFDGVTDTFSIDAPVTVDKLFAGFWLDIYATRGN